MIDNCGLFVCNFLIVTFQQKRFLIEKRTNVLIKVVKRYAEKNQVTANLQAYYQENQLIHKLLQTKRLSPPVEW